MASTSPSIGDGRQEIAIDIKPGHRLLGPEPQGIAGHVKGQGFGVFKPQGAQIHSHEQGAGAVIGRQGVLPSQP